MKKIMFNEHYGLETATLNGSKTRTSRYELNINGNHTTDDYIFIKHLYEDKVNIHFDGYNIFREHCYCGPNYFFKTHYFVGEIIAIAQSYEDAENVIVKKIVSHASTDEDKILLKKLQSITSSPGIGNKMFIKSKLMPHQIQITDIKLERMQDISDEDCIKEGIIKGDFTNTWDEYYYDIYGDCRDQCHKTFKTPKEAFADLIDKVSGKGTWRKNPWIVVYYYQLIK